MSPPKRSQNTNGAGPKAGCPIHLFIYLLIYLLENFGSYT